MKILLYAPRVSNTLSLKYILIDCDRLNSVQILYFSVNSYEDIQDPVLEILSKIKSKNLFIYLFTYFAMNITGVATMALNYKQINTGNSRLTSAVFACLSCPL